VRKPLVCLLLLALACSMNGCVDRILTIKSEPAGALVALNDLEVGRTPLTRDFTWYGTYDVELRAQGYEPLRTKGKVIAPWWQWVPFDLFAEILPFHFKDHQELNFTMKPISAAAADPDVMLQHAAAMRAKLQSSPLTKPPSTTRFTTRPTSRPAARHPATTANTRPSSP
jgi:hypothetical protein